MKSYGKIQFAFAQKIDYWLILNAQESLNFPQSGSDLTGYH